MKSTKESKGVRAKYLLIPIMLAKSFFSAITQVAWGVAGIFLFNIAIAYLIKDGTPTYISKLFLQGEAYIANHITLFVGAFFIMYFYYDMKELRRGKE